VAGVRRSASSAPRDALVMSVCRPYHRCFYEHPVGKVAACSRGEGGGLKAMPFAIDGVGISLPIRLGSLRSVVSSPAGSRAEPQPKMYLVHFIYHRTSEA